MDSEPKQRIGELVAAEIARQRQEQENLEVEAAFAHDEEQPPKHDPANPGSSFAARVLRRLYTESQL